METVAIVGVGLIGGSFGLALREAGFRGQILGVSSSESIRTAVARGAVDREATLEEAAASADLLYLALPISGILAALERLARTPGTKAFVTDAGSTKRTITDHGTRLLGPHRFLGGHPMAGKEKRGVAEAEAGLFRGRPYLLTPEAPDALDSPQARSLMEWLECMGARVVVLTPEEHDRLVARVSHLPQLLSTSLASLLGAECPNGTLVSGPGLMDMTRLALSSFEIWGDILATNGDAIGAALDSYVSHLEQLQGVVGVPEAARFFEAARGFALAIRGQSRSSP